MKRVVIIGAGVRGNKVFADLISRYRTGFSLVGVVESDADRRLAFQRQYRLAPEHAFASVDELVAVPRIGDIAFICTPDPTHFEMCKAVSHAGYDVLLEKPIATNLADCLALLEVQQSCKNQIIVAHVLRYAPFFRKVREVIVSNRLGSVRHVDLSENISHWHFAHSYVRGNWRKSSESAPIILTKSSHDLDLLHWLLGERVVSVTSHGGLTYFTERFAPPGATDRCVDCPHQDSCLYSATRFYMTDRREWPYDVATPLARTREEQLQALSDGPYGKCVYRNDNDVCDHQVVLLEFESGVMATFGLHAHTSDNTRTLRILFDYGELKGDLRHSNMLISHFTGEKDVLHTETVALEGPTDSHGGGDLQLLYALYEHLTTGEHGEIVTSLESSLTSHVLAFLAEESRIEGNVKIPIPEIFAPVPVEPEPPRSISPPPPQPPATGTTG